MSIIFLNICTQAVCVCVLADELGISKPFQISILRVCENAGVIKKQRSFSLVATALKCRQQHMHA